MTTPTLITLRQFLLKKHAGDPNLPRIAAAMEDLAQATRKIAYLVSGGALGGTWGSTDNANVQGETQKKLDVISNDVLLEELTWSGHWTGIASEEMDDSVPVRTDSTVSNYLCLFDPLDGSSNIDINGGVGTIFSILRCPEGVTEATNDHFLQPGTDQVAAGFTLYGPATVLVLTTGNGVNGFTLDIGSGDYLLTHPDIRVPAATRDFTVNMANQRYWAAPMQRYVNECMHGTDSDRGVHFNMRYVGSMVADVYRLLINGGIFLYPWDSKDPDKPGKLRLLYEGNPMSFIVEQAGGASSTGLERIMEIRPEHLHQRCPVVLGSKHEVERVVAYHREAQGSA